MKASIPFFLSALLLSALVPAYSQEAAKPAAKSSFPIQLKLQNAGQVYLSQNSGDYVTVGQTRADYYFVGDGSALRNGAFYKIKLGGKFLYETSKGNAGVYDTANDEASSWCVEKQKSESRTKDDIIHHGDVIQLRNGYWTDNYLCDYQTGYAAAGSYNKPRNWVVEFDIPEVEVKKGAIRPTQDLITDVIYISNRGQPASTGATTTYTLNSADEVGVAKTSSDHWEAGLTIGGKYGNEASGVEVSVEATAAFGQEISEEKSRVSKIERGKSLQINYERPADAECFLLAEISVPYGLQELSCEGAVIQMRSFSGQIELVSLETLVIPHRSGDMVVPELQSKVDNYLSLLGRKSPQTAQRLRNERLPVWRQNGWVVDTLPVASVTPPRAAVVEAMPPRAAVVTPPPSSPPVVRQTPPVKPAVVTRPKPPPPKPQVAQSSSKKRSNDKDDDDDKKRKSSKNDDDDDKKKPSSKNSKKKKDD